MPYKRKGGKVYVRRNGRWVLLHDHGSDHAKAQRQLVALRIAMAKKGE